jgi:CysZ protein
MTAHRALATTRSAMADFFAGIGDLWRGCALLLTRPGLWVWALIPFILNILFFVLLGWGAWHFVHPWFHHVFFASHNTWLGIAGGLVGVLFWLALLGLLFFSFLPMATLIASPFNDILSEKVERIYAGLIVRERFCWRDMSRAISVGLHASLRLTLATLLLLGCALLLHVIPVIGSVLATAVSAAITIRFLSLQFTAYSMDRRFYSYAQRRDFLRRHRARTLGLGVMAFLVMMVPVVNALFIPISAIAGTLLFCDTQPRASER